MSLKMFRILNYHHLNIIPQSVVNKWRCMGGWLWSAVQSGVGQKCIQYAAFGG